MIQLNNIQEIFKYLNKCLNFSTAAYRTYNLLLNNSIRWVQWAVISKFQLSKINFNQKYIKVRVNNLYSKMNKILIYFNNRLTDKL